MQQKVRNIIFHTKYPIDHIRIGRMLQNRPDSIYINYIHYIPYYVKHVDYEHKSVAGKIYTPIWADVWRKITNDFVLNYSYLPVDVNAEQSFIDRRCETNFHWSVFDTHSAASSTIKMPETLVKNGDIILFQHCIPAHSSVLM
jgi:hypothetical protein